LKLISCWANAGAQPLAKALAELFPGVLLQGKGLLATEAPVTIPWIRAEGHVPLLDGVLVELEEASASGEPAPVRLLHEAEVGGVYKVVVSQRGGLLRYRLGDRVRVTHRYRGTPCLELLGRGDDTSDLVGEKLSESFVTRTLEQFSLGGAFFRTVAPLRRPKDRYALVVDRTALVPEELASRFEEALCKAHHYGHARSLGQLGPLEVHIVPDADQRLQSFFAAKGMRWGDRKHRLLQTTPADDWLLNPRQGHHP
jgi:hypothetical protein